MRRKAHLVQHVTICGGKLRPWFGLGLVLLILASCSAAPGAVAPPATPTPGGTPDTKPATPTGGPPAPRSTPAPAPTAPPEPSLTLPPTPELAVADALGQMIGPLLLYNGPGDGPALLLRDLATGKDLWLTAQIAAKACDLTDRTAVDWQRGMWSADGRFLLISCSARESFANQTYWRATYLLDRQTGVRTTIAPASPRSGSASESQYRWSPTGHDLLIAEVSAALIERWSILDAATGRRAVLSEHTAPSVAAWAPDGRTVALAALDGTTLGSDEPTLALFSREGVLSQQISLRTPDLAPKSRLFCCVWSPDQQRLFLHTGGISPHDYGQTLQVDLRSEQVTLHNIRSITAISPDSTAYLGADVVEGRVGLAGRSWYVGRLADSSAVISGTGRAAWLPDGQLLASTCDVSVDARGSEQAVGRIMVVAMDGARQIIADNLVPCRPGHPSTDGSLVAVNYPDGIHLFDRAGQLRSIIDGQLPDEELLPAQWSPPPPPG